MGAIKLENLDIEKYCDPLVFILSTQKIKFLNFVNQLSEKGFKTESLDSFEEMLDKTKGYDHPLVFISFNMPLEVKQVVTDLESRGASVVVFSEQDDTKTIAKMASMKFNKVLMPPYGEKNFIANAMKLKADRVKEIDYLKRKEKYDKNLENHQKKESENNIHKLDLDKDKKSENTVILSHTTDLSKDKTIEIHKFNNEMLQTTQTHPNINYEITQSNAKSNIIKEDEEGIKQKSGKNITQAEPNSLHKEALLELDMSLNPESLHKKYEDRKKENTELTNHENYNFVKEIHNSMQSASKTHIDDALNKIEVDIIEMQTKLEKSQKLDSASIGLEDDFKEIEESFKADFEKPIHLQSEIFSPNLYLILLIGSGLGILFMIVFLIMFFITPGMFHFPESWNFFL